MIIYVAFGILVTTGGETVEVALVMLAVLFVGRLELRVLELVALLVMYALAPWGGVAELV
jgi:hypothetical protein